MAFVFDRYLDVDASPGGNGLTPETAWDWAAAVAGIGVGDTVGVIERDMYNVSESLMLLDNVTIAPVSGRQIFNFYSTMTTAGDWIEVDPADGITELASSNLWFNPTLTAETPWVRFGSLDSILTYRTVAGFFDLTRDTEHERIRYIDSSGLVTSGERNPNNPNKAMQYESSAFWPLGTTLDAHADYPGSGNTDGGMWVYSVGNPITVYGTIYYANSNSIVFWADDAQGIHVEGLGFRYCTSPFRWSNATASTTLTGCVVRDLDCYQTRHMVELIGGTDSVGGVTAAYLDDGEVYECTGSFIDGVAFKPNNYLMNFDIHHNTVSMGNMCESAGCFYYGEPIQKDGTIFKFRKNTLSYIAHGLRFAVDGAAVYIDHLNNGLESGHAGTIEVSRNHIQHSTDGILNGSPSHTFVAKWNYLENVGRGFEIRDSQNLRAHAITISNNLVELATAGTYQQDRAFSTTGFRTDVGVQLRGNTKTTTGTIIIKNNIIVGQGANTAGIFDTSAPNTAGGIITESYNTIYNCGDGAKIDDDDAALTLGTSTNTSDPTLNGYRLIAASPAIDTGTEIAGITTGRDFYGNYRVDGSVDRGCSHYITASSGTRTNLPAVL